MKVRICYCRRDINFALKVVHEIMSGRGQD
jgi:hypothetical protein